MTFLPTEFKVFTFLVRVSFISVTSQYLIEFFVQTQCWKVFVELRTAGQTFWWARKIQLERWSRLVLPKMWREGWLQSCSQKDFLSRPLSLHHSRFGKKKNKGSAQLITSTYWVHEYTGPSMACNRKVTKRKSTKSHKKKEVFFFYFKSWSFFSAFRLRPQSAFYC